MKKGNIKIFTGEGHGKSASAIGQAIQAASLGQRVAFIQFLKGKGLGESEIVKRLEPEINIFRFERTSADFRDLSDAEKEDAIRDIKNGINYANKVLRTGEYDLVVLDEVFGLIDQNIITVEELQDMLNGRAEETDVIMTGITLDDRVCFMADEVDRIEPVRFKQFENTCIDI